MLRYPPLACPNLDSTVIRRQYLPHHNHATSSLRLLIATTIASSFSSIQLSRLQKWLDMPSSEDVQQFVGSLNGWTVEGDSVKIEGNGDNDVKAGVVREQVELSRKYLKVDHVVRIS
jgi:translation initiation factor 3 subunit K